jgi:hypothetical protein
MPPKITIKGLDKLRIALGRSRAEVARSIRQAGDEAANRILDTQGLRAYPPNTQANLPPHPYYVRGRGTFTGNKYSGKSARYGTRWGVEHRGYGTVIFNTAKYAKYLAGDPMTGEGQAHHMGPNADIPKGWRELEEVTVEKIPVINEIFQGWVDRAIRRAGLK